MPRTLTKKEQQIVSLASLGGNDSQLLLLEILHSLEDEVAKLKETIGKEAPIDAQVEKTATRLAAKLALLEKGDKGDTGERGETGPKGKDGVDGLDGIDGKNGIDGKDGLNGKDGSNGLDGVDGRDADETAIVAKLEADLPALGSSIRDGLELLRGKERLSVSAIEGIDSLVDEVKTAVKQGGGTVGWGAHPLTIQQAGTTISKTARFINFVGATVAQTASGVTTVTTGVGGSVTGTVDGSNLIFTAATTPTIVFTEGGHFTNGFGVTISGLTITFDAGLAPQQWIKYV
jgi:hypothetical protein